LDRFFAAIFSKKLVYGDAVLVSLFSNGQQKRESQAEDLPQKQQATHREEYRASVWDFFPA
jgi:hypothetical protein